MAGPSTHKQFHHKMYQWLACAQQSRKPCRYVYMLHYQNMHCVIVSPLRRNKIHSLSVCLEIVKNGVLRSEEGKAQTRRVKLKSVKPYLLNKYLFEL